MKKKIALLFVLLPVLIATVYLFFPKPDEKTAPADAGVTKSAAPETMPDGQRLLFLLQYIGLDYNAAVRDGEVIDEEEYDEMKEFGATVLTAYRQMPEAPETAKILGGLEKLQQLIAGRAAWPEVRTTTHALIPLLAAQLQVVPYPLKVPDLRTGKKLYADYCADCHGLSGDGRGPSSADLNPMPSNFNDATRMLHLTPYQFYNAMTFGVEGTAMGSFTDLLTPQDRWEIAFYVMTMQPIDTNGRPVPEGGFTLRELATESNSELAQKLAAHRAPGFEQSPAADSILQDALRDVELLRRQPPRASIQEHLAFTRGYLKESFEAYQTGDLKKSSALALDAYLHGIEKIEIELKTVDADLERRLERQSAEYRAAIGEGAASAHLTITYRRLLETLDEVEAALRSARGASSFSFIQSLTIILREGIEAVLLLGLMITYLTAAGYKSLRRHVVWGGVAGVVLGLITWAAAQRLVTVTPLHREALEGLTSLLAAAVLFSISLWIIHNADLQRWKAYLQSRAENAISAGSKFTLIFAAFLAVYREAFETVLFYQVLWMRSPAGHNGVVLGFFAGVIILAALMVGIFRFGMRIPLKPFFVATGLMLAVLTFVFVGYGIRELQTIGWIKETPLPWDAYWGPLEIYPTAEGLLFQLAVVMAFLLGWMFTRWGRPQPVNPAMDAA